MTPGEIAQLTATVALITAVVSSITAVVVTLVGQYLTREYGKDADARRWAREDDARRRLRAEDLSREGLDVATQAYELLGWAAGYDRGAALVRAGEANRRRYVHPAYTEVGPITARLHRIAMEISDRLVARHFRRTADVISNSRQVWEYGGGHPGDVANLVLNSTVEVVGAFLRGEEVPSATGLDRAHEALEVFWKDMEEQAREEDYLEEQARKKIAEEPNVSTE